MSYVPINSKALEGQARLTPYTGKPVEISVFRVCVSGNSNNSLTTDY